MKAERRRWQTFGRTVAVATLLAAPLAVSAASTATGGVVRFVGMIVAPPLQISADTAPTGVAVDSATVAGQRFSRTVTFSALPGGVSGADVALEVNGGSQARDLVATRFVDASGHVASARDGHYAVDRAGGVLSLNAKRTDTDTRVIVVVSYN
jgi:type 1 fimbria pilin